MKHEDNVFKEQFRRDVEGGAEQSGISAEVGDIEVRDEGEYSVMSWVLRDREIGKDIVFTSKISNADDEVLERQWEEKDSEGSRVIRYENFEAMRKLPHDAIIKFKAVEDEILKSRKKRVN
ncbi:MAG: hypothetical protein Q8P01_01225 [bacterium]|nr:hypothetical protein [bacterium]